MRKRRYRAAARQRFALIGLLAAGCGVVDPSYQGAATTGGPDDATGASTLAETTGTPSTTDPASTTTTTGVVDSSSTSSTSAASTSTSTGSTSGSSTGADPGCGNTAVTPGDFCFSPGETLLQGGVLDLAVGDFEDDGFVDILVGSETSVQVLRGGGNGEFPVAATLSVETEPYVGVAVGRLNDDAVDDALAVQNSGGAAVLSMLSDGDGSFADPVTNLLSSGSPRAMATASLDADMLTDVITTQGGGGTLAYHASLGDGTLAPSVEYAAGTEPVALALAQLGGGRRARPGDRASGRGCGGGRVWQRGRELRQPG